MKNWSGAIKWTPSQVKHPQSEAEIQAIVQEARAKGLKIRMIGSAHSFVPLYKTNDILISLDQFQGLVEVDKENLRATLKAGTKLYSLGDLLYEHGMAMENLGDIDRQSIAGTISTGTHGTGINFGTISTQVRALRFVNGNGDIIECSEEENQDLFKAAQVSLGALGIITQITLQLQSAYKLELVNDKERLEDVLKSYPETNAQNRNFEFYWFPYSDYVWTKKSNISDSKADKIGIAHYFNEYILENLAFKLLCEMAHWFPGINQWVSRFSADMISSSKEIQHSHKVYATTRWVRFNEMEYNVPLEAYPEVMKEVIKCVNSGKYKIHFPIENRFVKADDIYLSPAHGRDSAYIACHVYNKKEFKPYFKALEDIFRSFDGRPHWGKYHTMQANDFEQMYPKFQDFLRHRNEQDPDRIFSSDYINHILS